MTANPAPPPVCPQCGQNDMVRRVSNLVQDEPGSPLAQKLAAPRSPRPAAVLGCATSFFAAMVSISAAILATGLTELTSTAPRTGLLFGVRDTSVFTGIITFLFVFVGVHAMFVWRQAQASRFFRRSFTAWHRASERWQQLHYCLRCDGVFLPGQSSLTPVDQVQMLLYAHRPSQGGASAPASAPQSGVEG
ncbi:MAG: hypothetical protein C0183_20865 [Roseiflexus castenholzii]|uniref:hypothetical protein n=1 Tax=Roseiflexus castenholzii TaxID=120962 RepID=UPI000CC40E6E|nr:MAG: hypothetical protein C0183_20865 [Roseiflexus castenholzii]